MMNRIKRNAIELIAAATRTVFGPEVNTEDIALMVNYMFTPSIYVY